MAKNTIKVKNYSDVMLEFKATAYTITPGHLVQITSGSLVQKHADAAKNVFPLFAVEDELQGKSIDDAYAASTPVQVWVPGRGDIVYALLKNGENVVIGDFLESAGDGTLQKHVPDVDNSTDIGTIYSAAIVGVALEAVDMSGSSGADPSGRIQVMIL